MKKTLFTILLTLPYACTPPHLSTTTQSPSLYSPLIQKPSFQQSNYQARFEQIKEKLRKKGFEISSSYFSNPSTLIYLPDIHTTQQTQKQILNLEAIQEILEPDVYFLESLSGKITPQYIEKIKRARRKRKENLESLTLQEFFLSSLPTDYACFLKGKTCYGIEAPSFYPILLKEQAHIARLRKELCFLLLESYVSLVLHPFEANLDYNQRPEQIKMFLRQHNLTQPFFNSLVNLIDKQQKLLDYLAKHNIMPPTERELEKFKYQLVEKRSRKAAKICHSILKPEQIGLIIYGQLHTKSFLTELKKLNQSYIAIKNAS